MRVRPIDKVAIEKDWLDNLHPPNGVGVTKISILSWLILLFKKRFWVLSQFSDLSPFKGACFYNCDDGEP